MSPLPSLPAYSLTVTLGTPAALDRQGQTIYLHYQVVMVWSGNLSYRVLQVVAAWALGRLH